MALRGTRKKGRGKFPHPGTQRGGKVEIKKEKGRVQVINWSNLIRKFGKKGQGRIRGRTLCIRGMGDL